MFYSEVYRYEVTKKEVPTVAIDCAQSLSVVQPCCDDIVAIFWYQRGKVMAVFCVFW